VSSSSIFCRLSTSGLRNLLMVSISAYETRRDGTGRARSSFPDDGRDLRRRGARSARRGEAEEEGVELGR
jgi:hypothetical protein